jgi:hypothetical protein
MHLFSYKFKTGKDKCTNFFSHSVGIQKHKHKDKSTKIKIAGQMYHFQIIGQKHQFLDFSIKRKQSGQKYYF